MKIITVNLPKGGTGKSTFSFNFAKWLADEKGKKVLLIDGDYSCNLTFSVTKNKDENSVLDIFLNRDVILEEITENLNFLKGSENLNDKYLDLMGKHNNRLIFYMWLMDNLEFLEYDYILIDTHNNKELVTLNFLAVADIVIGVSDPSRNGLRAWFELEDTVDELKAELVEARSRESYVNAKCYLVGNRVNHVGNTGKNFLELIQEQDNYLGMIQTKELLAKSLFEDTSVFEAFNVMSPKDQKKHQAFMDSLVKLFEKIIEIEE